MKKVITNKNTRYYYEKGDKIVHTGTNAEFTVESIDIDNKKIITADGVEIDLTIEVRPTEETRFNAKVVDRRRKFFSNDRFTKKIDKIFFSKVNENAIIPTKDIENACYDLYACFDEEEIIIRPNEIAMIGTGIATAFNRKFKATVYERGSTGSKGMAIRCGIIDSGYRGEWFIPINNTTKKTIIITKSVDKVVERQFEVLYPYTKAIAQFALEEVPKVVPFTIPYENLMKIKSNRGTGKLGSSNK